MHPRPSKTYVPIVAAAFAAIGCFASREAHASDITRASGFLQGDPGVVIPVALNAIFTTSDVATLSRGERGSQTVAVAEIIVTTPQLAYYGIILSANRSNLTLIEPDILFVWAGALFTHGVVTLALGADDGPKPFETPSDHPHLAVAPTMLGDATRTPLKPGFVVFGSF